jgi:hypothetical protein
LDVLVSKQVVISRGLSIVEGVESVKQRDNQIVTYSAARAVSSFDA